MKHVFVVLCGVATGVLATTGMLFIFGHSRVVAWLGWLGFDGSSPWPVAVLSVMVVIFGLAVRDNLVAQKQPLAEAELDPAEPPNLLITTNVMPLLVITIICGLALLAWLGMAIQR